MGSSKAGLLSSSTPVDRRGFFRGFSAGVAPAPLSQDAPNPLADPRTRIAHLLRRAGFGATQHELDRYVAQGYEATVDWLLNFNYVYDEAEDRLAQHQFDFTRNDELKRWWLIRMRYTTRPLQEKLTLFLHGFLTSGLSKSKLPTMMLQNQLLRASGMGQFGTLLVAISRDPAMLLWLDGNNSRKQHPNENYAREMMELFTIGIGRYTEQDVQEAARAFTGWRADQDAATATYVANAHDNGIKTFMGQTGRFGDKDIIAIILQQRATAENIAKRLWTFFAYPGGEKEVLAALANNLVATNYNIASALRFIFLSDAFSSPRAYRAIVKSPVDYVISTYRALELETDCKSLVYTIRTMGQDVFDPPNVAGWPGGPSWLNTNFWLQRANFANSLAIRRKGDPGTFVDLAALTKREGLETIGDFQEYMSGFLLDGQLNADSASTLESYRTNVPPKAGPATLMSRKGSGLLYLMLASPEYQLL